MDVGPLIEMRLHMKKVAEKHAIKLSFMPFFMKAVSLALSQFPVLNASVNENCTEIIYKSRHNIGLALDTVNGLVVPNIKDVQSLQLFDVAKEVQRLIEAGRSGTLAPADLSGGTFSLSNIGSVSYFLECVINFWVQVLPIIFHNTIFYDPCRLGEPTQSQCFLCPK